SRFGNLLMGALAEVFVVDEEQVGIIGIDLEFQRIHVARGGIVVAGTRYESALLRKFGAVAWAGEAGVGVAVDGTAEVRADGCEDAHVAGARALADDPHAADDVVRMQRPGILANVANDALARLALKQLGEAYAVDGTETGLARRAIAGVDEIRHGRDAKDRRKEC